MLTATAVHFEGGASEMSITIHDLLQWKQAGKRFAMLTAYDFPTARILDEAGIPVLLVGDSVGNNVLGYETTLPVTMQDMLHHTKAVTRGARNAMVVGDMPFGSYQVSVADGIRNAARFLQEGGAQAVKVEGPQIELIHKLVELGIPVMAHVGLTPQSVHGMGGYRVQDAARRPRRSCWSRRPRWRRPARSRSSSRACRPTSVPPSPRSCTSRRSASGPDRARTRRSSSSTTCSG
jgi:ketopantoate hydroxymethyltransferase